jgi:hypothetical protein
MGVWLSGGLERGAFPFGEAVRLLVWG